MTFEQRVSQFIRKNKLIDPRGLVIVGVSGGADSMALLLSLVALRHELGIQLHVAHFNHKFRSESSQDERFVQKKCQQLQIPLTVASRRGGKIKVLSEDEARTMRFEFFVNLGRQLHAQSVALAHTRNDLAETVLMRLMRGSGLYGLRAILPCRSIEGMIFVRPLLDLGRKDVEAYLKSQRMPFCLDTTNQKAIYERNKVRLRLLPLLAREYNPQIINVLSDLALSAGEDYEFLSLQAQKQFEKNVIISPGKVKMDLKGINRQHPAILRLILRKMVETLTQNSSMLSFEHIHDLENLIVQNEDGRLDLPHRLKAQKKQKYL